MGGKVFAGWESLVFTGGIMNREKTVFDLFKCEQCVERDLDEKDVKKYLVRSPDNDTEMTLCKSCVDYLRHEEHLICRRI